MKKAHLIMRGILLIISCVFAAAAYCDEAKADIDKKENYFNSGILLGGTGLISYTLESVNGNYSFGLNIGEGMGPVIPCLAFDAKYYFRTGDWAPFLGFGIWEFYVYYKEGFGYTTLLYFPMGIDWKVCGNMHLGAEISLTYMIYFRDNNFENGNREGWFPSGIVPIPGLYLKWEL